MNAIRATVDLDDTEELLAADRDGLLRSASMAGAAVRATAAAVDEGALDEIVGGARPRSVIWVAGRGTAQTAGHLLAATAAAAAAEPIVVTAEVPAWIGPLDTLVVAGDDPADPALVAATATGVRRGARVVLAAPFEGPLRDAGAGRAAVLAPRLWIPDEFHLSRYLAAGLATLHAVDSALPADLGALADELDAEALRNSAGRELFTNPAKSLAERMAGRAVVLAGDCAATLALARHGAAAFLRLAGRAVASAGVGDALAGLRLAGGSAAVDPLFHDEEIDGPLPERLRVFALVLAAERPVVSARIAGVADVDLVGAGDVPDMLEGSSTAPGAGAPAGPGRAEQQLATLAVRLEMAAVYLKLARGRDG